eukprot:5275986-Karenia_brevis.AAC.1
MSLTRWVQLMTIPVSACWLSCASMACSRSASWRTGSPLVSELARRPGQSGYIRDLLGSVFLGHDLVADRLGRGLAT